MIRDLSFRLALMAVLFFAGCGGDGLPGTCSYEGKMYPAGSSFPASDGCNSCGCQADGSVACTEKACLGSVWLQVNPVQCGGNPWEQVTSKGDGMDPIYPTSEHLAIDNYFEDQGIDLLEIGLVYPPTPLPVCKACTCPRGDAVLVRAQAADAAKLVAKYGFTQLTYGQAQSYSPKQCNNNPWKAPDPGQASLRSEAESVMAWLSMQSASASSAGFVFGTATGGGTCAACSCGRGDRLVAFPADSAAGAKLPGLGFEELPQ